MKNQLVRASLSLVMATLIVSTSFGSTITGTLIQEKNGYKILQKNGEKLNLEIPEAYNRELPSLSKKYLDHLKYGNDKKGKPINFPSFYMTFDGEKTDGTFVVKTTPTITSGFETISGKLTIKDNEYYINDKLVSFVPSVKVNDSGFDEQSIDFFVNKNVLATITNSDDKSMITAIVPADLYSANKIPSITAKGVTEAIGEDVERELIYGDKLNDDNDLIYLKKIFTFSKMGEATTKSKIRSFALKLVYDDAISRTQRSFRETIYTKGSKEIKKGDTGLIITFAGRQGDDTAALAGHLAAGIAKVQDDLSLRGEIWNFYNIPNEKKILPGHNSFVDYFGNLTAGQNNYRPTYSLIFYGVSSKIINDIRNEVGKEFYQLREDTKGFGVYYNCTTVTVNGLENIGLFGKDTNSMLKDVYTGVGSGLVLVGGSVYPGIPHIFGKKDSAWDMKKSLQYLLWKDPNAYLPRAAFDGYVANIKKISKKFKASRVDYIFHAQTPSARPVGGVGAQSLTAVKDGKDIYDETVDPANPWTLEEIESKIQDMMK